MRVSSLFILLVLFSCSSPKNGPTESNQASVEKILNMTFTSYDDLWQKVKDFETNGQTKSAYEVVKKIYQTAQKDHNSPQLIKALLYQSKYMMRLEEDSQLKIIRNFEQAIASNPVPSKNILESYLAQLYWQFYRQNRWRFAKRTETAAPVDPKDFRTWDLKTIYKAISTHFDRSLQDAEVLQQLPIDQWQDILELSKEAKKYQPVLYDLLVQEALNYYQSKENALTAPAYKFSIDNPEFLSDLKTFISLKINSKDSFSQQLKALQLYQSYLKFRSQDAQHLDALALADLKRLNFVYNNAVFPGKDAVYLKALQNFVNTYQNSKVAALAMYHQAKLLYDQGNTYRAGTNDTIRWRKKEALQICQKAISAYPKSEGAALCENLKAEIQTPIVTLKIEQLISEQQPALVKLIYKNIDQLQLKLYQVAHEDIAALNHIYDKHERKAFIEKKPLYKSWSYQLKNDKDYQTHSIERVMDALPNGEYILLITTNSHNDIYAYQNIQVTDVALQSLSAGISKSTFSVINRLTGQPVTQAKIAIQKIKRNGHFELYKTVSTDSKGEFALIKPRNYYQPYLFTVTYDGGKKAYFQDYIRQTYQPNLPKAFNTAFIFTDRAIYRLGQEVYFKAIVLNKMPNKSKVIKKQPVKVILYDVNHQKLSEKHLLTNDFGSVHSAFSLPVQTLTGQFTIEVSANDISVFKTKSFRVEAYKRPKFEVILKQPEKTYKVNEEVAVEGLAQSFAGTNLTGAQVTYRVKREVIMPRWWFWYRPNFSTEAQEIAHGQLKTDVLGRFIVRFKALPDLSVKPEQNPIFHYKIYAEVTDLNGETHAMETTVNVGYQQLQAQLILPKQLVKNQIDTIKIKTTNLNAVPVAAKGEVQIFKLQSPGRVLRKRPWEIPDFQEINKAEFIKLFPHIAYDKSESKTVFWPKGKLYFTAGFDTAKQEQLLIKPNNNWPSGKYLAVLTTQDKDGKEVTDKQIITIYSSKDLNVPDEQYLTARLTKQIYQPGDNVLFQIGSAAIGNRLQIWIEKQHKIIEYQDFTSNGHFKNIRIPVTEKDRGGFVIHYAYHAFNDYITGQKTVKVPYPSQELEIETLSFRDKLKPGQQETWRFKIKGTKAGERTAEILAAMYDASLDQFVPHQWQFDPINFIYYHPVVYISQVGSYKKGQFDLHFPMNHTYYDGLNTASKSHLKWFGFHFGYNRYLYRGAKGIRMEKSITLNNVAPVAEADAVEVEVASLEVKRDAETPQASQETNQENESTNEVPVRTNFNETAFFYPQLYTDKSGDVSISFTVPESLTKWKLQLLAHTPSLKYAYQKLFAQTQKDLMVFPNAPRFVREGDRLILSTKISNLTDKTLQGLAKLQLVDAISQKDITAELVNTAVNQNFSVDAEGNTQVSWSINIPKNLQALQYKITAQSGQQSDGEQNLMPVLSNRMLVTETMPMWVRGHQSKTFVMDKLLHNQSSTLQNHRLTLEITGNPAWYAVQALPYLMEYPYECSEQTFARYYANALAGHIVKQNPKIKQVFDIWKKYDTEALWSNLEKNQELKSIIIEETPWLRDAQSEQEQKKRIALLFDFNRMSYELQTNIRKLQEMQLPNGGFVWFKGGHYANRYITAHIVEGFGHLSHLGVDIDQTQVKQMLHKAIVYLDKALLEDYKKLQEQAKRQKNPKSYLEQYHTGAYQLQYLYARSFYPQEKKDAQLQQVVNFYRQQAQKFWLSYNLYEQGLLALVSKRHNEMPIAKKIIRSLDENSIKSEEMGMYWKNNTAGWHWYQAPIETQALLIEAFDEIDGDRSKIDDMRIWLLKNKQTNAWKTTKQTTEAVYALLLRGSDWLSLDNNVNVKIGSIEIDPAKMPDIKTEAGTGYFKKSWPADQIKPDMAKVSITKKDQGIAWGALYWQYFEDLDKITHADTPVSIKKDLFIRRFTDTGEVLQPIDQHTKVKTGDLVRVRVEIKVDRPMEYVHLKDMRAAGFEPVNVLSTYKWQDGLGYYESTGDAATNFFISYLPKGVYVFEYDLRANNAGSFSNGITSLQCMYAPEFSSHSKGQHVDIQP